MIIKGFQPTSLLDYPGNIASIIFTAGCNFRCPYCYNKQLVMNSPELEELDEERILEMLAKRKKLIDGVVITGGEPTLHKDLPQLLEKIKKLGLKIKLDTNGANPEMIQELINKKLIDFIAMDIKSPLEKYEQITRIKTDTAKIKKSVEIIMKSGTEYEFRTTAQPDLLTKEDFQKIGQWLKGAKKYCIQQFKTMPEMIDETFKNKNTYSKEELEEIKKSLANYFEKIEIRA
jgi:pyruvate formate lyase activating enzyme